MTQCPVNSLPLSSPVDRTEMSEINLKRIFLYLLCYLLWLITSALGMLGVLIARAVIDKAYIALRLNPWAFRAVDNWSLLLLGLMWLVFVIACEGYYREGMLQSKLWPRFAKVTGAEGLLVGVGYVVQLLI